MYYATSFVLAGKVTGVLAETHEGRPTKIEGNPLHPNSLGGTDVFAQASLLDLYDPDRSRNYLEKGEVRTREEFVAFAGELAKQIRQSAGKGLAILSKDYASPALDLVRGQCSKSLPDIFYVVHEAQSQGISTVSCDFRQADVILAIDSDCLGVEDEGARNRQGFAAGRRVDQAGKVNRLYVVEPAPTNTGTAADHRLRLPASQMAAFLADLQEALRGKTASGPYAKWIEAVAADLRVAGQRSAVVVGARQPSQTHTLAAAINKTLGSQAVKYFAPPSHGIAELAEKIKNNQIQTLVILGGNPAYDAPANLDFASLIAQVPLSIHLGLNEDETGSICRWHVPAAHYLESWGDACASDGTVSVIQPMIDPMFVGMTPLELLARLTSYPKTEPYEIVRDAFAALSGGKLVEDQWRKYLQEGVFPDRKFPSPTWDDRDDKISIPSGESLSADRMEVCFAIDPKVYDGRFANNGWLQELPDPITKLAWDNAAILSAVTAKSIKVDTGDVVKIEINGRSIEAPVFVLPGTADWSITLPLGYGRTKGGSISKDAGFNAYILRTSDNLGYALGVKVTPTGRKYPLATTQEHWAMDLDKHFANVADEQARERALIREGTTRQYQDDPQFAQKMGEHAPIKLNIYTSPKLDGANQWGLAVDLTACVGCNACVVACQAENNIPIVGKNEVINGREMHWLRMDRYFVGENDDEVRFAMQPMACQHCENAPCEPVCPVNATVHSPEGLNEMVYNRCIGTRYCSNNCPYKVRRFNFYDWNKGSLREDPAGSRDGRRQPDPTKGFSRPQLMQPPMQEMLKMSKNPNVSVRMRGVMEKCTYCVQRLESAKIAAQAAVGQGNANAVINGKPAVKVPVGTVMTACQQVCPTQAISFGDVTDKQGKLAQARNSPRSYEVLEHLNVRPRTRYLARVRNVNPKLEATEA